MTLMDGRQADLQVASDPEEARWNYAFWIQNSLDVVCDEEAITGVG
ncbi:MAG: hypothetical protein FD180_2901 [Planctomycetota bacterium]|nr:MAG: hypothetical protein FD180_2901 [Planctomycetota bacterium]